MTAVHVLRTQSRVRLLPPIAFAGPPAKGGAVGTVGPVAARRPIAVSGPAGMGRAVATNGAVRSPASAAEIFALVTARGAFGSDRCHAFGRWTPLGWRGRNSHSA
jgi:hypothetical protein